MANSKRIYLIQGNDTDMSVCLRKGGDTPLPYDLTGASRIGLALTGHGLSFFARDIEVSGEDNNIISGLLAGDLLVGEYGLEVSFTLDGKAKRFRVPQVFEVVTYLSEDQDGTAEGEGDGISITVTVQPEVIEIAGPTGPQGKSAYQVWLDEGHTGDEDDFFRWLAAQTPNPDWDQNDASEPDYVENRTHYDIPAVSLPDAFITFRWTEEDYSDLMFYLNDETPMPRVSENVWGVQLGQWLLSCYINGNVLEVDLDGDPILTVANFRPGSTPQPIPVGDIEVPELVQPLDGKYLALKTVNGQSVKGSGDIALNGGNLEYTGNDGEYISGSDSINGSLLLLDEAVDETNGRIDNLKGSEVVYDGEDGDSVIVHGDTVDQCLKGLDDQAAYIIENYQYKIPDIDTIRAGAALGATAYQKPSTGIPKSALASAVKTSLEKADTALQPSALNGYATEDYVDEEVSGKQDTLISGENIKTINGQSILGSGDIQTGGGSADAVKYTEQTLTDAQKTQARTNIAAASESEVSQLRSEVDIQEWKLSIGGIQTSDGWETPQNIRLRSEHIYESQTITVPNGYTVLAIVYYDANGGYLSYAAFDTQSANINLQGASATSARIVISKGGAVMTEDDIFAIQQRTRIYYDEKQQEYFGVETERKLSLLIDDLVAPWTHGVVELRNMDRFREGKTNSWTATRANGFAMCRIAIPSGATMTRIKFKNTIVAPTYGYLPYYFSANSSGSAAYISAAPAVKAGVYFQINDVVGIPSGATYLWICLSVSGSAGDIIENNTLAIDFNIVATNADTVVIEQYLLPKVMTGYLVDSDTGDLVAATGYPCVVMDISGKGYKTIRTRISNFGNNRGYGFVLADGSWVGVHTTQSKEVTINVPEDAVTFKFCWNPSGLQPEYQYFYAGVETTVQSAINKATRYNSYFFPFLPKFDLSEIPATAYIPESSTLSDVYDRYDALLASYPNYITKIDCSDADSALGLTRPSELSGMPIYIYKFSPKLTRKERFDVRPRAFIITGLHSNEKMGIYTTYAIMKMICENWASLHDARILRTMAEIYVLPILNPWGFVNAGSPVGNVQIPGRQNYNGVNLNRNFPSENWTLTEVGVNYSGPSAGSEYETKIAMYYAEQINPDFFLDVHTGNMNIYGAMGAIETMGDETVMGIAYAIAWECTTRLMIDDSSFGGTADQSLYDVGRFVATGEMAEWAYENVCELSYLTEQCIENKWENGILTPTTQSINTDTIFRENMQFTYNMILKCLFEAAIEKSFNSPQILFG